MTCLITVRCAGWSSLTRVQVLVSPAAIIPLQPREPVPVYPEGPPDSVTLKVPTASATVTPVKEPANDGSVVPLLVTVIVQAPGAAVPPLSLITRLMTVRCAG